MRIVPPFFVANPNVGIGVALLASAMAVMPAFAGWTPMDWPDSLSLRTDAPASASTLAATVDVPIPFYAGRAVLGPKGRAALRLAASRLQNTPVIEAIGRADGTPDADLARRRAETLVKALAAAGISASRISVRIEDAPVPDGTPRIWLASLRGQQDLPVPPVPTYIPKTALPAASSDLRRAPAVSLTTPATIPAPAQARYWRLETGETLRDAITRWARIAGWQAPVWQVSDPYHIERGDMYPGSLLDALSVVAVLVPDLDIVVSLEDRTITVLPH